MTPWRLTRRSMRLNFPPERAAGRNARPGTVHAEVEKRPDAEADAGVKEPLKRPKQVTPDEAGGLPGTGAAMTWAIWTPMNTRGPAQPKDCTVARIHSLSARRLLQPRIFVQAPGLAARIPAAMMTAPAAASHMTLDFFMDAIGRYQTPASPRCQAYAAPHSTAFVLRLTLEKQA